MSKAEELPLKKSGRLARRTKLANHLSILAAAIIVLLPMHALLTTWAGANFGHLDLFRIWKEILLCLMVVPAIWLAWGRAELSRMSKLLWLTGLYATLNLVLGVYALIKHQVNGVALIYALIINLRFLMFFFICWVLALYSDFLRRHWLKILLIPAIVVIAFGVIQRFILPYDFLRHFGYGPNTIPAYQTVDSNLNYRRLQSTLRGANPLGAYLVLIISALLTVRRKLLKIISVAVGLVVLFYSYSRSAWLGLAAGLTSLGLIRTQGHQNLKKLSAAGAALVFILAVGIYVSRANQAAQDTLFHTSASSTNVSSNSKRAASIKQGFEDVIHQPLGRGPGTAGPASFRNSGHAPRIAENYYLQIGQETGVVGLGLFLAINWLVFIGLWRRRGENLSVVLLASFCGISLINLVSHAWTDDTLSLLWWGLAGVASAPVILKGRQRANGKAKEKTA